MAQDNNDEQQLAPDVDGLADQLLGRADAESAQLLGPDGLLTQLTQRVLNRALDAELAEHLGYEKGDAAGRGSGNNRNGTTSKKVLTDIGAVEVNTPRDRNGSFEPKIVPKHARRLVGFNEQILSLYARGMSVRDIRAHLHQMYGVEVSGDVISRVTDAVTEEITIWQNRPLDPVWPIVYIDALWIKIRDGAVSNRPVYLAVGVDLDGCKHILGLWIGPADSGEGARFWASVLAELRNRGITDVLICCCDGLTGLPDAITATWPQTTVQTCCVHLMRASMRFASKKDYPQLIPLLKAIYTAPTEAAAEQALQELEDSTLGRRYPAIGRTWRSAWPEFAPFLAFPPELRRVVYSTNMIESINARLRKVTRNRGHFTSEAAAVKVLYLAIRHLIEPKAGDRNLVPPGWKSALNQLILHFGDRITIR
ncbi:IS256 family transposase [Nocardia coffeae]|uniref:IS256 family transposase n=1 Tax=Nocardia coffeae TaxID=2873381 RepID=UPI00355646BF